MATINQKNWQYFQQSHEQGKLSHAYLFCGPEGTGKFGLAIDVIRMVDQLDLAPEKIISGGHPDVFIVRPEVEEKKGKRKVKNISIEQIKNAIENIGLYAYQAKYKFLVIDKADKMTVSASNSLLKLIEEPPADTIIILTTFSEEGVLPTIRSRCQRIRFGLQNQESLVDYMRQQYPDIEPDRIARAAELSRGRIRFALEYMTDDEQLARVQTTVEEFRKALRAGVGKGFALAESISQDKQVLLESLEEWIWYLRCFQKKLLKDRADIRVQKKTFDILKELLAVREILSASNANERLQLEQFFVQIN